MKMFSNNKDHEQFIETVVEKNNTINRKLLNIQVDQELRRNHKWARMTKEIAFKNNVRQIRYLIANNLTRPLAARERDKQI